MHDETELRRTLSLARRFAGYFAGAAPISAATIDYNQVCGPARHDTGQVLTFSDTGAAGRRHGVDVFVSELRVCRSCFAAGRSDGGRLPPAAERPGRSSRKRLRATQLQACPWCMTTDLYIQKDFPQGLGLFIVGVGFAISTVFWYYEMPIPAYLVLVVSMLLDLVMYHLVGDVTICYRCLCQLRGAGTNPDGRYRPFDLASGERYRQERIRARAVATARGGGGVEEMGRHAAVAWSSRP